MLVANYYIKVGDLVQYKRWDSKDYPDGRVGIVLELNMEDPRYPAEWQIYVHWNQPHLNLGYTWWEYYSELEVINEGG